MTLPAAQRRSLRARAHRPYPLPRGPWVMGQTWVDLLFAHWPLPPEALQPHVPLPLDTFGGDAWLGVVPFEIHALRARGMPAGLRFAELNVRTYVTVGGRPGVYFFSLDAASRLAVAGARAFYRLPYFHAAMGIERRDGRIAYRSRRPGAALEVEYEPAGDVYEAAPGTLDHFLVERYCLYTARGRRAEIHHGPWPLQPATATFARNTMFALPERAPLLHFAARQDVVVWPLRRT